MVNRLQWHLSLLQGQIKRNRPNQIDHVYSRLVAKIIIPMLEFDSKLQFPIDKITNDRLRD